MTEQNEPSMEDILASIRNILAEDDSNNAPTQNTAADEKSGAARAAESPEPARRETAEVRDVRADGKTQGAAQGKNAGVVDLTADMIVENETPAQNVGKAFAPADEEDDFTPEPVIPSRPMKEETLTDLIKENGGRRIDADDDMLLAEPTVAAATESLSHLRDIASEKRLEMGNGALTIETIVRETLKPYLKEWLDVNLPDIVERVVKKEIAHVMDRLDLK